MPLCCLCGVVIEPNSSSMCLDCFQKEAFTIPMKYDIFQCDKCLKFHVKLQQWLCCELLSDELLTLCVKRIVGSLEGVTVSNVSWVSGKSASNILNISLDAEQNIADQVIYRKELHVEVVIKNKQCLECSREGAEPSFGAVVQIRQRVSHKKTLASLETDIRSNEEFNVLLKDMKLQSEGFDVYCRSKGQAERLVNFVRERYPSRTRANNHADRHEAATQMDLVPLGIHDVVITPSDITGKVDVMLVIGFSACLHLMNPFHGARQTVVKSSRYFSRPFTTLVTSCCLIRFIVLNVIEPKVKSSILPDHTSPKQTRIPFSSGRKEEESQKAGVSCGNRHDPVPAEVEVRLVNNA